jgi:hypothetical protein
MAKRNLADAVQDIDRLKNDGWTVKRFSPVHYRVTMEGMRTVVDVWPTTKKMWRHGALSRTYKDICRAIETEFSHEY